MVNRAVITCVISVWMISSATHAAVPPPVGDENEYYRLLTLPLPEEMVLEVGGLTTLRDGRVMVATRRGEVFIVENALTDPPKPLFKRYAFGLAEPLGLLQYEGWIYAAQRGELTRMKDIDGDDQADVFETVCDDWEISGSYHEYAFGPRLDREGWMWVTLNKPFGPEPYGFAHYRGWAVRINPATGKMQPMCVGLRSPAGVEVSPDGDVFYTDNQGEWCNSSKLSHLEFGDFHGHPHGLPTTKLPESPIPYPGEPKSGTPMPLMHKQMPTFKMPAVYLPYEKLGESPAGMVWDTSGGRFGPFTGQMFIGDQHDSIVMRVFLEQVEGHWQGACFPFRAGLQCGVTRVAWGADSSMLIGQTNRGWGSIGTAPWGMQRLVWTGKTPFEIHQMRATRDGFVLMFTMPVDPNVAMNAANYRMNSYTYLLEERYGGPEYDKKNVKVTPVELLGGGRGVRVVIEPVRLGYVYETELLNYESIDGQKLLHTRAYYTLVNTPGMRLEDAPLTMLPPMPRANEEQEKVIEPAAPSPPNEKQTTN